MNSIISEISPSFAMKMNSNGHLSDDIYGDNIEDICPSYSPFLTNNMGHPTGSKSKSRDNECYNFNFRNGAPISGKEYFSTPTFTHG